MIRQILEGESADISNVLFGGLKPPRSNDVAKVMSKER